MSATESPGSHSSRAAWKADTLDADTSRHMPRWMKMCDGMWRACETAGAISA